MLQWALRTLGAAVGKNKLSIVIYHQVFEQTDPMRPSEPDAKTFDWQMSLLSKYFTPISLTSAMDHLEQGTLPSNAVCVTFDDGYLNNLEVAQPILEKYQIPATVYIATGFSTGQNMWNDRLIDLFADQALSRFSLEALGASPMDVSDWDSRRSAAYSLIPQIKYRDYQERQKLIDALYVENNVQSAPRKMMTPDEIRKLSSLGVDIGAHTVDHPILQSQDEQEQLRQIQTSKETLENWLQKPVTGFAYPNGKPVKDYGESAVEIVKKLGFRYAVSTRWGNSTKYTNPFELNRFTPWDNSELRFHTRMIRNLMA